MAYSKEFKEFIQARDQMIALYNQLDELREYLIHPDPMTLEDVHRNSALAQCVLKALSEWMKQQQMV